MKDNLDEIIEYYKQNPYKWMEEHFGIKLKWYQKQLINIITICDIKNLPINIKCKRKE